MMHGSPSIAKSAVPWNKSAFEAYATVSAVGVLAGIIVADARMPLHLPGHKVLWWMIPVLVSRVWTGARVGASIGALATILSTISLGGRLAGGVMMMPLVVVAGVILDVAVGAVERRALPIWGSLFVVALAATAGNLVCFVKRLLEPGGASLSKANIEDLLLAAGSYALFGFVAGLLGAAVGRGSLALSKYARREGVGRDNRFGTSESGS